MKDHFPIIRSLLILALAVANVILCCDLSRARKGWSQALTECKEAQGVALKAIAQTREAIRLRDSVLEQFGEIAAECFDLHAQLERCKAALSNAKGGKL